MTITDSALAQIRQLHPYQPGKPIEELERELGISHACKLASNENPLGCPEAVSRAIDEATRQIELYPDANAFYLKQRLAAKLDIADNQITIGNGSNDVLDLIARSFLAAGRSAVFSQHAFMVYGMVTQACGAAAQIAPALPATDEQPLGHDLDAMLKRVDDSTRLVFVANPNNPTGTWIGRGPLKRFVEQLPDDVAVVIDEAYFEYVEEADYPDALEWLPEHPNLIVTRTFSKIYGLAGLRVGYAISDADVCNLLNRVRQPFNGNSVALAAACAALDDDAFVERSRRCNRQGLASMRGWFGERGIEFIPSVGNFLTVKFGDDSERIYQGLLEQGVIVRPVANYGMPEYLRISVGTEPQLQTLYQVLDSLL